MLTYSLEAIADTDVARADAASFDIDASTGQLITKAPLDATMKTQDRPNLQGDGDGGRRRGPPRIRPSTQPVTITVTNASTSHRPRPAAPTVVSGQDISNTNDVDESTTTLKVIWHAPENTGEDIHRLRRAVQEDHRRLPIWRYGRESNSDTATTVNPLSRVWKPTPPTRCVMTGEEPRVAKLSKPGELPHGR